MTSIHPIMTQLTIFVVALLNNKR